MRPELTVYIIDDDRSVLRSMERLLLASGVKSRGFSSVEDFLAADCPCRDACLVSDILMSGIPSLELPALLAARGKTIPTIFLSATDEPETRSQARAVGASAFLRKPVDAQALLDVIDWAMQPDGTGGVARPVPRAAVPHLPWVSSRGTTGGTDNKPG